MWLPSLLLKRVLYSSSVVYTSSFQDNDCSRNQLSRSERPKLSLPSRRTFVVMPVKTVRSSYEQSLMKMSSKSAFVCLHFSEDRATIEVDECVI